jgi:hypothetical protein
VGLFRTLPTTLFVVSGVLAEDALTPEEQKQLDEQKDVNELID